VPADSVNPVTPALTCQRQPATSASQEAGADVVARLSTKYWLFIAAISGEHAGEMTVCAPCSGCLTLGRIRRGRH
jgi:hypothetical protein